MPACRFLALAMAALLTVTACSREQPEAELSEALACQAGAWVTADGTVVSLLPVDDGLRWRLLDGRGGKFQVQDGAPDDALQSREGRRLAGPVVATASFAPCDEARMRIQLGDGPAEDATRLPLVQRETRFTSDGVGLQGRLVLPTGEATGPVPLAVLVHGSGRESGLDEYPLQHLLPAQGVAVFVYDKRGTGGSDGDYSQDFRLLAADAVAALAHARQLHPDGFSRVGFVGTSQGGWVGPLAASRSDADYVVALYGMAENALAEDREQVLNDLRAKGYGDDVLAKAREATDATALLMASGFTRGFDELQAVHERHGREPWFDAMQGEFTGQLMRIPAWTPRWLVRRIAARQDVGTSWDYEPMPVLQALVVPQLWVIAGDDRQAPNVETLRRLRALQAGGRPLDLAVFPGTDHGIYEYEQDGDDRIMLRNPDGYFRMIADWIKTPGLRGAYGSAILEPAPASDTTAAPPV
ncbi:alpha/beta hydrolase [Luteimonas sp. 100069]|uniref:alpha/beta hydrolase family protein n=1 Tax=Luteimonas sp. 100069 TaxID=2006109 RepID=UPI000F4F8D10|nr:alpha/beta hydrolase [Luteimonas sp. 100069]RPD83662.1 alpha/beta hydrolase [Luteimonas sp. 100069]